MSNLFRREIEVTVNDTKVINDRFVAGVRVPGLRVRFNVTRDVTGKTNRMTCEIFNLKEATRNRMAVDKPRVVIDAGYTDNLGSLFNGVGVRVSSTKESTGYVTEVEGKSGLGVLTGTVNKSFAPGTPFTQILCALAEATELDARRAIATINETSFTAKERIARHGFMLSGRLNKILDQLSNTFDFTWTVQNGELIILTRDGTVLGDAVLLSPGTGLVDSPEEVFDEKRPNKHIIKGTSLLQPRIIPGSLLQMQGAQVSGRFKVMKVQHTGDTHGEQWHTNFEAEAFTTLTVAQAGVIV